MSEELQNQNQMEKINDKLESLIEEADNTIKKQNTIENQQNEDAITQEERIHICARCGQPFYESQMYSIIHENKETGLPTVEYLCARCKQKLDIKISDTVIGFTGLNHFRNAAKELIAGIEEMSGRDLKNDQNFIDTPNRVARAWYEIMRGVKNTDEKVKSILNTAFESEYKGIICANNITCWGVCPHHLLPVKFVIKKIGYVAGKNKKVLGISKLKRLVDVLAAQPILQEDLADQITEALMSTGALGAAVTISAVHCCMVMRGAKATGANVITSSMKGCFEINPSCKSEFLAITSDQEPIF